MLLYLTITLVSIGISYNNLTCFLFIFFSIVFLFIFTKLVLETVSVAAHPAGTITIFAPFFRLNFSM